MPDIWSEHLYIRFYLWYSFGAFSVSDYHSNSLSWRNKDVSLIQAIFQCEILNLHFLRLIQNPEQGTFDKYRVGAYFKAIVEQPVSTYATIIYAKMEYIPVSTRL